VRATGSCISHALQIGKKERSFFMISRTSGYISTGSFPRIHIDTLIKTRQIMQHHIYWSFSRFLL
jgi:hypothetical protein